MPHISSTAKEAMKACELSMMLVTMRWLLDQLLEELHRKKKEVRSKPDVDSLI